MSEPAVTLVLADATLADGTRADIHVAGPLVAGLVPIGTGRPAGAEVLSCAGRLVAPSFVEGHIHLDKTLLGTPFVQSSVGATVAERIEAEKALRRTLDASVQARGGRLVEQVARFGTGAIRSHVDIDTEQGLAALHEVLALKERYAHLVDLQIVAFPQSGILRDSGTADLLDAALREGADLVGGLDPAGIDGDVGSHLDVVFGLAAKHDVGVDIHLHDPGPLGAFELRDIAARTRAAGLGGRVVVSHAYALGTLDPSEFGLTAHALAEAGVALMTNGPGTGSMPPVLRLRDAGVTVFAGSDNIRDAWSPYGDGDMLARAAVIGYRQDLCTAVELAHAFAMATTLPAAVLGLTGYGLQPGGRADLVVIDAVGVPEAVVGHPSPRTVIKRGRVVVRDGVMTQAV